MNCTPNPNIIKQVFGNTFQLAIPLQETIHTIVDGQEQSTTSDYFPTDDDVVVVNLISKMGSTNKQYVPEIDGNLVTILDDGTIPVGVYGVEVRVVEHLTGERKRFFNRYEIEIVEQTRDASLPAGVEFNAEVTTLEAAVFDMMRGYSEYDLWLQAGHSGTVEDFMEWVQKSNHPNTVYWGTTDGEAYTADFDPQTDTVWHIPQVLGPEAKQQARENIGAASTAVFGAAGSGHSSGLVPDPGSTAGTSKFLREDGTWAGVPGGSGEENVIEVVEVNGVPLTPVDKTVNVDLTNYVQKSQTAGLLKNDGTVDTTQYGTGTITGITMNGVSKGTSGVVNLGTVVTSETDLSVTEEGAGNAVTGISVSGHSITATKGSTFLTASDIAGKENKISIDSTAKTASFFASVGNYYIVNVPASTTLTITLTTPSDNSNVSCCVFFVTTDTGSQIAFGTQDNTPYYTAAGATVEASKVYEINALWNGTAWCIAQVELEAPTP